ncbi:hypothetical protein M569_04407, partial [Genlisea aurea]
MWTNIFKIGGLQQISWFQFLPQEIDFDVLSDKSLKSDQHDAASVAVLLAHLQLQKEGFLSTWTNSFVGPWDPSQGLHNPDEKIKLWLFLPGQHSSIVDKAQVAVSRLRVLASGLWISPGDSEEVANALSQALRNSVERALKGFSYMRFGDVFSKYHPQMQNEEPLRKGQPVAEFIFAATEEAIFVHVIISARHVRSLVSADIETHLSSSARHSSEQISVVVSPHGMRGKLSGYCPDDIAKQVNMGSAKGRGSNELVGLPHLAAQVPGFPGVSRGKSCFVEVTLGCYSKFAEKNVNAHSSVPSDKFPVFEKPFAYPSEAVLVPVIFTSFARSSLKSNDTVDLRSGSSTGTQPGYGYHSSNNSNSSSNCSMSSSSGESGRKNLEAGDLDADADSLMTRQSGLSSLDQIQSDGSQSGTKRLRAGNSESFGQAGMVLNPPVTDCATTDANNMPNSVIGNEHCGSQWGWDDDDGGIRIDIQDLLAEFGDFGDFFETDILPIGEPPGSEESQGAMLLAIEGGEPGNSPNNSMMDVSDQILLPSGFQTFDSLNQLQAPTPLEDIPGKSLEAPRSAGSGQVTNDFSVSRSEFDDVVKAEALMTFASDYGAVETSKSVNSSVIFQSPYTPKYSRVDSAASSNNHLYSATLPCSPCFNVPDEKSVFPMSLKACKERSNSSAAIKSNKYYTYVERGKQKIGEIKKEFSTFEGGAGSSQFSGFVQNNGNPVSTKESQALGGDNLFTSLRNGIATHLECLLCQASMCRLRHTLLPSNDLSATGLSDFSGNIASHQGHIDSITMAGNISNKYELKKKEILPARIVGDLDTGVIDGPLNAPIGVWRSVGIPKVVKAGNHSVDSSSLPNSSFLDDSLLTYGHRQPLLELLDGIPLLVQQAASFVDLALDADCGDGPFGYLAIQEQTRRGLSCGPLMAHAGCGGLLASCHSLDISGTELVDPLSLDVQASLTISLLQSDMKAALKSAFSSVDGPLPVTDWCRGRSLSNEAGMGTEGFLVESNASASECRDSSITVGEPMSPSVSSAGPMSGTRGDEAATPAADLDQQQFARFRPTLSVVPFPSILVGYQDDWLKTSASSLQFWEKAPLEPYATTKHMSYYVVCPNIDPLVTAAADFFLQLGTVYETCKLGTHIPQSLGNEKEIDAGKISPGFALLDCPQSMKIDSNNATILGSISDYFLCLSNGWDLTSYLRTLTKVLKTLKFGSSTAVGAKERNSGAFTVVYVVCPFPDPLAILQAVVESSIAIGTAICSSDKERRSMAYNQVAKALSHSAAGDESLSNVLTLTGFSIPRLVLQIVTVDAVFRVTSPMLNELVVLKEIAFAVYNKARRFIRGASGETLLPGRSPGILTQMSAHIPGGGMWKDVVAPRIGGSHLQRESEVDSSLRPGSWDSSWQASRSSGHGSDQSRNGDTFLLEDSRCLFEPLYILSEPGSFDRGIHPFSWNANEASKLLSDDCASTSFVLPSASSGSGDKGSIPQPQSLDSDAFSSWNQKAIPSLHCCYGWTEDWRWMVCIWTDSRGELFDSYVYPFGGISSRQDTKGLQSLFIQILQQGCHILQACSPENGIIKPRELVIARIGTFFELECQEWHKALFAAGGSDVKKWSLQLRRSSSDLTPANSNGNPMQQQDIGILPERVLPSSSSSSSSPNPLYNPHAKASTFMKGGGGGGVGIGQSSSSRKLVGGHAVFDNTKGLLQWVQSVSFISVAIDHSLHLVFQSDLASSGTGQFSASSVQSNYVEGYTPVKSLGSAVASYILIPSPSMRFLPPTTLQLPTCLTADSPPLAHLLHSKGSAIPMSTGFVVSRAVPSMRRENRRASSKGEWPSVVCVSLIDYYGGKLSQEKVGAKVNSSKREGKDVEVEILESIAAELHALSWMTVSPAYLDRRTALPFHCDMLLRVRRLLHFADK